MISVSGCLLVVDDDEANRDILSHRLARQGYEVSVAEDGSRASAWSGSGRSTSSCWTS